MWLVTSFLFLRTAVADPGIVPLNTDKKPAKAYFIVMGRKNQVLAELKYCHTCNLMRPLRSQHCYTCDRCVKEFDHHCIWLGTCVAARNYKTFMHFLLWLQLSFAAAVGGLAYQASHPASHSGSSIAALSVLGACLLILWVLVSLLFVFHLRLIVLNNTTNEYIKKTLSKHKHRWNPHSDYTLWGQFKTRFLVGRVPVSLQTVSHLKSQIVPSQSLGTEMAVIVGSATFDETPVDLPSGSNNSVQNDTIVRDDYSAAGTVSLGTYPNVHT